jgi:large subunit ribosomal protein L9
MDVILTEDYPSLGYIGDTVTVKRGFARNFLIPRGKAVEVTSTSAKTLAHKMGQINALKARKKAEAEKFSSSIAGIVLEFGLKFGQSGKSFGSVTTRDIEEALAARGFIVDRRQIKLQEPIRLAGDYRISVKLHAEVTAPITVSVVADSAARALAKKREEEAATADGADLKLPE